RQRNVIHAPKKWGSILCPSQRTGLLAVGRVVYLRMRGHNNMVGLAVTGTAGAGSHDAADFHRLTHRYPVRGPKVDKPRGSARPWCRSGSLDWPSGPSKPMAETFHTTATGSILLGTAIHSRA